MVHNATCDADVAELPLLLLLLLGVLNIPVVRGGIDSGDTRERDSAIAKILIRVRHGNPMAARRRGKRAGAVLCVL